jgi:hypothetical protein
MQSTTSTHLTSPSPGARSRTRDFLKLGAGLTDGQTPMKSGPRLLSCLSQTPGANATVTFATEGTVEVRCAIHPGMKLTVQVSK